MYKKQKIEIMIEKELHAPNLSSAYKNEIQSKLCGKSALLNKSNIHFKI